jgi:hypothetical protein
VSYSEKCLKFILRLNGVLAMMAVVAVVMPHAWLAGCVSKVEPGLPVEFVVGYLARSLSMFFVLVGAFLVIFSTDVLRYRVPITVVAIWILMAIFCFGAYSWPYLSDLSKQWFFWFVVGDATWSFVFALAILVLQLRVWHEKASSRGAEQEAEAH